MPSRLQLARLVPSAQSLLADAERLGCTLDGDKVRRCTSRSHGPDGYTTLITVASSSLIRASTASFDRREPRDTVIVPLRDDRDRSRHVQSQAIARDALDDLVELGGGYLACLNGASSL
jgi:hypothetical protein